MKNKIRVWNGSLAFYESAPLSSETVFKPLSAIEAAITAAPMKDFVVAMVLLGKKHVAPSVKKIKPLPLWVFTFITGGYNQVYAENKKQAIVAARERVPNMFAEIDWKSFHALRSKKAIAAYWASFPLMD